MSTNWIEIEENLVSVAQYENFKLDQVFRPDGENESYYKEYGLSKHMNERIMEYDFHSPIDIRKYLHELWGEKAELKDEIIKILMMMQHDDKHLLDEVRGHNYTL